MENVNEKIKKTKEEMIKYFLELIKIAETEDKKQGYQLDTTIWLKRQLKFFGEKL